MFILQFQFHADQAVMFSGVIFDFTLVQAYSSLGGFMACEWHWGVRPAALTPLCRADKGQECSFPQGDMLMCPFLVLCGVGILFFLSSSWASPTWANFQIHATTGFYSTSNIAHLPCFLQDLGMESTSLDDVLYRYASFRNLVDPITHDLIISLARYIHCPKPVGTTVSSHLHNCAGLGNRSAGSME